MNEDQKVRDREIARLESIIGGLRAEKQAHADQIASYRAIFEMVPVGLVVTEMVLGFVPRSIRSPR